jgi:hypothetical protein
MESRMTEQEFINKLIEIGYDDEEAYSMNEITKKMKVTFPDMTYEELIPFAKDAHESEKNETEGFLRFCGGCSYVK